MLENQKQLSLLLSVLVQTELHSVWQSFPNSHNTRDFRTTIIEQSVNYKYNTYPQRALNIPVLSATAPQKKQQQQQQQQKNTLPLSCQPQQNNSQQRMTKNNNTIRMTSYQCDVVKWRCHHVTWSIHKMTSHGRTVTMALPDSKLCEQASKYICKPLWSARLINSHFPIHLSCQVLKPIYIQQ